MDEVHNPSRAMALVAVDELVRCGVTDAVLAPGSRSTALAMAFHDDPRVRLHVQIDERSAGFLAIGLARASGRPAAVIVTSGSAVANLHPAVVESDTGHVPLLLLTADRPPELRHTGANQTIEQVGLFGRAARWSVDVGVAEDRPGAVAYWRSTFARAVGESLGLSGPAGPVQVNLPFREPTVPASDDGRSSAVPFDQQLDGRTDRRPWTAVRRAPRLLADEELLGLAGRIAATERGLVVVGASDVPAEPVLDLASGAGWPVIAEPTSAVRTGGSSVVTTAHHLLAHPGFAAGHRPDLVIRIGRTGLSRHLAALLGPDVPQILIDPDGAWHDPERAIGDLLVADVAATCAGLARQLGGPAGSDWADDWRAADELARDVIDGLLDADDVPCEPRVARDLGMRLPAGATLVAASSMPIRDLDQFLPPRRPLRVISNRGASGIDGFVSTVLGVALATGAGGGIGAGPVVGGPAGAGGPVGGEPAGAGGPVVALAGDLSLLHDANGFLLSPDAERIDAVFVVVDNDGGGIFSFLPQAGFPASFERVFGTPHGRDLERLAHLHRLGYGLVETASELPAAVDGALAAGGLQLVHVRTDRAANVEIHRRLTQAVAAALDDRSSGNA